MAVKLFILSTDCNPMSELPFFSVTPPPPPPNFITWNGIIAALDRAKYTVATRRLPCNCSSASEVVFLTLLAAKKAAFLYDSGDHCRNTDRYQITYTENQLMNSLPSHVDLRGLPRFHLFESLPEHLQWAIVQRLDLVDYFRLRPLSPQMRRIQYSQVSSGVQGEIELEEKSQYDYT